MAIPRAGEDRRHLERELSALRARVLELETSRTLLERLQGTLRRNDLAEREFSGRLATLVAVVNELSTKPDVDSLCQTAVELGRSPLGFERVGVWLRAEHDNDMLAGAWGVTEAGELADERNQRVPIVPGSPEATLILHGEGMAYRGDAPILDRHGEIAAHGAQALCPMWNGAAVIGHVSTDNALTGAPLRIEQCEILRLYSNTLGHLITRKRAEEAQRRLIDELQDALGKIRRLSGLIPICASCKKIRDDQGFWQQVEEYIRRHSEAEFSHSICPECTHRLYPELSSERDKRESGDAFNQ